MNPDSKDISISPTVDILILGAGWTSQFLIPLCDTSAISYAATSRPSNHKPHTIDFEFNQNDANPDKEQFSGLPDARTVLITFPISVEGASERLVRLYKETRRSAKCHSAFIQLGTTSIWDPPTISTGLSIWSDRRSPINKAHARGAAEEELLALSPGTPTTVLNLSGLWGGSRAAKHVVGRVAPTKDALKERGSLHMIHGEDVSRAIIAVHKNVEKAVGERWLLTDGRVYDWWDLAYAWGTEYATGKSKPETQDASQGRGPQPGWVRDLMREQGVRGLPRSVELLGRALDSRDFWDTFHLEPINGRLE